MAPSSRALATFMPLVMADWVLSSAPRVELRYCSATMAPLFVLTLNPIFGPTFSGYRTRVREPFGPQELRQGACRGGVQKSLNIDFSAERKIMLRLSVGRRAAWGLFCP